MLELPVAELDQAISVQPYPWNIAFLGGLDQGRRAWTQGPVLRITDKLVPGLLKVPVLPGGAFRSQLSWQKVMQQIQAQAPRFPADFLVAVLENDGVMPGLIGDRARAAESHRKSGDTLEFERHVLQHVSQPGALVLPHASQKAAGSIVGAGMFAQSRQRRHQTVDECRTQSGGWPFFQRTEVDHVLNDREVGIPVWPNIDVGSEHFHVVSPLAGP